jgi:hypothetical protein
VEGPGASLLEGPNPSAAHHCSGARHLNYAIIRLIWPLCGLLWSLWAGPLTLISTSLTLKGAALEVSA